jgi:hypothetical protein
MNHILKSPGVRALSAGLLILTGQLQAQTVPQPADPGEDVINLSPFVVSADKGWSANDTLSANRTRQALKEVPVAIDAITTDFFQDLGLGTVDEALSFVAGVYSPRNLENDGQQDALAFRGLAQRGNPSRNYFRWYAPSDSYNVERLDVGKGSNSLIFGEIEPGGQASVFTKRPLFRNFGEFQAGYTSEGAYRTQIDINRKVSNSVAMRFNAVKREDRTYQDASSFGLEGVTGALTWQPFAGTKIRLEGEIGDFDNARGFGGISVREQSGRSRGFDTGVTYTSDGEWIRSTAPAPLVAADFASGNRPTGGSPSLTEGTFYDVTMRNAAGAVVGTRRVYGFPKEHNIRGSFDKQARPFDTYTITVEQKVGPVDLEVAYNHQNQQADRTDNFFSSTVSVDVNGRPYIDSTLDIKRFGTDTDAFRALATYKFDKLDWTEQTLVLTGEYTEEQFENVRWQYYNVVPVDNGTQLTGVNTANDRARLRIYLDDPQFYSRALFDRMKPAALPATSTVKVLPLRLVGSGGGAMDGTQWRQASAFSASLSGRYWKNRVNSLIGFRRDFNRLWEYKAAFSQAANGIGPYKEEPFPARREHAAPGDYIQNQAQRGALTTFSSGVSVEVIKDINVYAAYGESFRFQDAITAHKLRIGPIQGESKELGVKGDLWDKKVTFTLGVFDIERINAPRSYNGLNDVPSADDLEIIMNRPNGLALGDTSNPNYKQAARLTNSASRNFNSTERSKGFDATIIVKPTDALQLRFTVARADVQANTDVGWFRDFIRAAEAYNAGPLNPLGAVDGAILNRANNVLNTFETPGRSTGARAAPWSASWIVDYDFSGHGWKPFKGLRGGINGKWRDDYLFGRNNNQTLIGGGEHIVSAYLMRNQKIFGYDTRIRLSADSAFDIENGKLRKTGFTTMSNRANVYTYSYVEPVQYELSVTVKF